MKRKISSTVILTLFVSLWFLTIQQTLAQPSPRRFYRYDVIATTNPTLDVFAAPSINDFGDVAFSGRKVAGGATFF